MNWRSALAATIDPRGAQARLDAAEALREFTALKYAGDCKCGKCQLVPRKVVDRVYEVLSGQHKADQ
jgi:hypothetical protein